MSTSKDGTLLTTIRDLARRRGRERRGLALAEGIRLVEEALAAGTPVHGAAVSPALEGTPRGQALKLALRRRRVRLVEVRPAELDALADTEHPQGVVAVVEPRIWSLDESGRCRARSCWFSMRCRTRATSARCSARRSGWAPPVSWPSRARPSSPIRKSCAEAWARPSGCLRSPAEAGALLAWAEARGVELWVAAADGEAAVRAQASETASPRARAGE